MEKCVSREKNSFNKKFKCGGKCPNDHALVPATIELWILFYQNNSP